MWTLGALPDVLRINFSEPPLKRASELLQIQHLVPVGFPCLRVHKLLRCLIIHEFDCFREDLRVSSDSYASHGFVDGLRNPDRFLPPDLLHVWGYGWFSALRLHFGVHPLLVRQFHLRIRDVAQDLETKGYLTASGKPFSATQVKRLIDPA